MINAGSESPTGPCCTGAGRAGADKHWKGVADNDERRRATSSQARLVADEAKHPIGKTQPQRITCNSSLTGAILPITCNPPDGMPPIGGASTLAQ